MPKKTMRKNPIVIYAALSVLALYAAGCDAADPAAAADASQGPIVADAESAVPTLPSNQIFLQFFNSSNTPVRSIEFNSGTFSSSSGSNATTQSEIINCNDGVRKIQFKNGTYDYIRSDANISFSRWYYQYKDGSNTIYQNSSQNPVSAEGCIINAFADFVINYSNIVSPVVNLTSPASGSTVPSESSATLRWGGADKFTAAKVYVGTSAGLSEANIYTTFGAGGSYVDVQNLSGGAQYFWKVELFDSRDGTKKSVSSVRNFYTSASAPVLSGTTFTDGYEHYPRISWTPVAGATGYRIRSTWTPEDEVWYHNVGAGINTYDQWGAAVQMIGGSLKSVSFSVQAVGGPGGDSAWSNAVWYKRKYSLQLP